MKKSWYFWVPRVLAILFIALISLFAFDAFEGNAPFSEKLLGFFIHLVPTYLLVILIFIAWKKLLIGGILYILAGASYFFLFSDQHWSAYLIVTGIPMLFGTLFIAAHFPAQRSAPLV
jgi:hypothetical protein